MPDGKGAQELASATSDWMEIKSSAVSRSPARSCIRVVATPSISRHAGPRDFSETLTGADGGRRGGNGDRRRHGGRGADDQAPGRLQAALDTDHHVRNKLDREVRAPMALLEESSRCSRSTARPSPGRSAWANASGACSTSAGPLVRFTPARKGRDGRRADRGLGQSSSGRAVPRRDAVLASRRGVTPKRELALRSGCVPRGTAIAGLLRLGYQQLRGAGDSAGAGGVGAAAAAARRQQQVGCAHGKSVQRIRLQDPANMDPRHRETAVLFRVFPAATDPMRFATCSRPRDARQKS